MAVSRPLLTLHSGADGTEPNSREYFNKNRTCIYS